MIKTLTQSPQQRMLVASIQALIKVPTYITVTKISEWASAGFGRTLQVYIRLDLTVFAPTCTTWHLTTSLFPTITLVVHQFEWCKMQQKKSRWDIWEILTGETLTFDFHQQFVNVTITTVSQDFVHRRYFCCDSQISAIRSDYIRC